MVAESAAMSAKSGGWLDACCDSGDMWVSWREYESDKRTESLMAWITVPVMGFRWAGQLVAELGVPMVDETASQQDVCWVALMAA